MSTIDERFERFMVTKIKDALVEFFAYESDYQPLLRVSQREFTPGEFEILASTLPLQCHVRARVRAIEATKEPGARITLPGSSLPGRQ